MIARDGLRACTVSALEQETGFARGHFTYHFRTKEEIIGLAFAAVASDWATTQIEATAADESAVAWLEHRVRAAIEWVQSRPDYFRCLMNFRVEMMRNPSAFPLAQRIRAQLWDLAAQKIREAIAEATVRPDCDAELEGRTVFAIVDGMAMHAVMDPTFHPVETLADRVWSMVADRLGVKPRA